MKISKELSIIGLQIKYTFPQLMILHLLNAGSMFGMLIYNLYKGNSAEQAPSFVAQMRALPLALSFILLMLLSMVVVSIGFVKQEQASKAMNKILLSRRKMVLLRYFYSIVIVLLAFMIHFITLCTMFFLYKIVNPEIVCSATDLYISFHQIVHLHNIYPISNLLPLIFTSVMVMGIALIPMLISHAFTKISGGDFVIIILLILAFLLNTLSVKISTRMIATILEAIVLIVVMIGVMDSQKK